MPDARPCRPVYLSDLGEPGRAAREDGAGLHTFLHDPAVEGLLGWPKDVVDQWPYSHAHHAAFLADYGHIDLASLTWNIEVIPLHELMTMPTGASENNLIEDFAKNPEHWVAVRNAACHIGVREMWDVHGTWKRWPILIARSVVNPDQAGLQVVEGRTRVGVLRGRARLGFHVAPRHLAWVGRARS